MFLRRRRRAAVIRLVVTLALVLGAAVYFLKIHPIYDAIHKGLDLQGGIELTYQASGTPEQAVTPQTLNATLQVIEYRVNKLGVSEPVVQLEPQKARILVELAGVKNPQQAKQILGTTANLEFKDDKGNVVVTGSHLLSATAEYFPSAPAGQTYQVAIKFDKAGAKKFAAFTAANQGKNMGIYVDGKEISNPVIEAGCCPSGSALINGNFTSLQQAQALAIPLASGALPLNLTIINEQAVSATLGAASVSASEKAAVVALALVVAFMFLIYRVPGLWADVALLVYAMVFLGVLAGINATLTLPGITGLILSIGMAVDSNVIIYERIKEELRAGRSLRNAVDQGFHHGLRAIIDSNATTVIAALVLYYMGSGLIRGFAVTVGIGVVISLLTAVVFTRYLLGWLVTAGAVPSWWFFAPRGELALADGPDVAAAVVMPAAPPAGGGPAIPESLGMVSAEPGPTEAKDEDEADAPEAEDAAPVGRGASRPGGRARGGSGSRRRRPRRGGR